MRRRRPAFAWLTSSTSSHATRHPASPAASPAHAYVASATFRSISSDSAASFLAVPLYLHLTNATTNRRLRCRCEHSRTDAGDPSVRTPAAAAAEKREVRDGDATGNAEK
ncbi:hypothetical protein OsI_29860 [Oryza sativa Indica Group]|uniref:Uncharacterized protein n=3 Tax=Oryza TaxID=4527 RepID=A3BUT0_ORYSJ|nr:hypothetical protein OsI_29860 [Oryza sativa Indica Group]EAZ43319.1 hypothetical protein OsJ_27915 [Oryza sativa Japonica Group]